MDDKEPEDFIPDFATGLFSSADGSNQPANPKQETPGPAAGSDELPQAPPVSDQESAGARADMSKPAEAPDVSRASDLTLEQEMSAGGKAGRFREQVDDPVVRVFFPHKQDKKSTEPRDLGAVSGLELEDTAKSEPVTGKPDSRKAEFAEFLEAHVDDEPIEFDISGLQPIEPAESVQDDTGPVQPLKDEPLHFSSLRPDVEPPSPQHTADDAFPTGEFDGLGLLLDDDPPAAEKRRKIPAGLLFIVSMLVTVVILGSAVLVWAVLTGNFPDDLSDIWSPPVATDIPSVGTAKTDTPVPTQSELIEPTEIIPAEEPGEDAEPTSLPDAPAPEPVLIAGSTITQGVSIMVYNPGGEFEMGRGDSAHLVTLSPYFIDMYEVTNKQWKACVQAGVCAEPDPLTAYDGSAYYLEAEFADFPVVNVNWFDAVEYCSWRGSRLPTEAEWEMAARWNPDTGAVTAYPWGDTWQPENLNYCDASCALAGGDLSYNDLWSQTSAVRTFPDGVSPLGLYDMVGNAAEWVMDWYDAAYYPEAGSVNPEGPETGTHRVVRGGAWGVANPETLRATVRSRFEPELSGPGLGFRCAVSPDDLEP